MTQVTSGMQNAGRNEPEHELRAVDVDGVSGVVSALIARDDIEAGCQQVDDFSLAFVAPLRAEHSEIHSRPTILPSNFASDRPRLPRRGDNRGAIADDTRGRLTSIDVKEKTFRLFD